MAVVIDTIADRAGRLRHPEKAHRPDQPVLRSSQIFQRLRKFPSARFLVFKQSGKLICSLPKLVEQARVFHCNDSLIGEILQQRYVFVGEGTHFLTVEYEGPEECITLEQRHQQPRTDTPKFDRLDNGGSPPAIAFAIFQVEDMND